MTAAAPTRINHVELRTRDLARSASFYRKLFGLVPRRKEALPEKVLPTAGAEEAFGFTLARGIPAGAERAGLDHISLEVSGTEEEVDALHHRAARLCANATRPRAVDGHYRFYVFDPGGCKVEVLARRGPGDG